MRMDLARGRERRSTTGTEAAEIDFMNIKEHGVDTGTGLPQSTRYGGYVCRETSIYVFLFFYAGYPDI